MSQLVWQDDTKSIQNSYVQNNQLKIVAMKEGYQSAMLSSIDLQEFTFGIFAAKIQLPFGKGTTIQRFDHKK